MSRVRVFATLTALLLAAPRAHAAEPTSSDSSAAAPDAAQTAPASVSEAASGDETATPPEPSWSDRIIKGTSIGEPSGGKVATVVSLYVASAASLAGGIVFTLKGISAGDDAEAFARTQPDNFCADRGSASCARYLDQRRDQSTAHLIGGSLLGASAFLLLTGALTAELWSNSTPEVAFSADVEADHVSLGFSTKF